MVNYRVKNWSADRIIPHTNCRYIFTIESMDIYDTLLKKWLLTDNDDIHAKVNLADTFYSDDYTLVEILAFTYMPVNIPTEDYQLLKLYQVDDGVMIPSEKIITKTLAQGKQRKIGKYLFKYSDNKQDWLA